MPNRSVSHCALLARVATAGPEVLMALFAGLLLASSPSSVGSQGHQAVRPAGSTIGELSVAHQTIPSLGVQVGKTTLEEVRKKLGRAGMPRGTGGQDDVCYLPENPDDHTLVLFGTHPYVGRDLLADLKILADKRNFPKFHLCGKSPQITKNLITASGLKLGLTRERVKEILGPESKDYGEYVAVDFQMFPKELSPREIKERYPHRIGERVCYALLTSADVRFAHEQPVAIHISMHEEGETCKERQDK